MSDNNFLCQSFSNTKKTCFAYGFCKFKRKKIYEKSRKTLSKSAPKKCCRYTADNELTLKSINHA